MTRQRVRHTTVPRAHPRQTVLPRSIPKKAALPRKVALPRTAPVRLIEEPEASLLDVIDSLLNKGVVLNADVILALADVDLVYLRLSALLCAADRITHPGEGSPSASPAAKRGTSA